MILRGGGFRGDGGNWGGRGAAKAYGVSFSGTKQALQLTAVIVAQLCEHTENH